MARTHRAAEADDAAAVDDHAAGLSPEQAAILDELQDATAEAVATAVRRLRALPQSPNSANGRG